jgi:hypothetical protein
MRNTNAMQILQPQDDLTKIDSRRIFCQFAHLTDGVKKIPTFDIFHNEEEVLCGFYDLVHLDNKWMSNLLHYLDLSAYTLDVCLLFYALFA